MASGNFVIGEQGLSLKGFGDYVESPLRANGFVVTNRFALNTGHLQGNVLVSMTYAPVVDLEMRLSGALDLANRTIRETTRNGKETAYTFQVGKETYSITRLYEGDATASELFPSVAQTYILTQLEPKVRGVSNQIQSLLGKRLNEL